MLYRIFNRSYTTKAIAITAIMLLLTACGGGGGGGSSDSTTVAPSSFTFGGSVGDGPIVGAAITVQDRNGNVISTQTSDDFANYQITLSAPTIFPLTITASGGTDLVTGSAPSFSMISVVEDSNQGTANINPFSTLIVATAQSMSGGLTASNLAAARTTVMTNLGFGIDSLAIPNAISTNVGGQNVANIVKASEALAEMVRRIRETLVVAAFNYSEDTIISRIANDLTDGVMDGVGTGADSRIAAAAHIVSAQILLESMINKLKVGGIDATVGLDNAIATTLPSSSASTGDVAINSTMIAQAKAAVAAARTISPSAALKSIAATLDNLVAGNMPGVVEIQLPATSSDNLNQARLDVATATGSMLVSVNTAAKNATPPPPPPGSGTLAITGTAPAAYTWGTMASGSVVYTDRNFTFNSIPAKYIGMRHLRTANDDKSKNGNAFVTFNVNQAVSVYIGLDTAVNPVPGWLSSWTDTGDQMAAQTSFRIYRKNFSVGSVSLGGNEGGGSSSMYVVMVGDQDGSAPTPPPAQAPTLTFSTSASSVAYNSSATLNWSSSNATSCSASGAWSGSKGTSGISSVGPLTSSVNYYTLTCSGDGGQVIRSVAINVGAPPAQTPTVSLSASPSSVNTNAATTLSWSTNNVDSCTASGGWSGGKATSGSTSSGALTSNTTFTLTCSGTGGTASQSVTVSVSAPPPLPAPSVTLSASPTLVGFNSSTNLSWAVSNADSCTASGGWSGSKNPAGGSQSSAALTVDTTFSLSCSGPGGSSSDSVTVALAATGSATLSWTPPLTNVDGSVLDDLAGYNVYYGTSPGSYTNNRIAINNPGISAYIVDNLPPGTYYFVVTAFDTSGNESDFSNMGSKLIN